jgi:hypothetical protein
MFMSIFDNIACVRGITFGGSLLESLIDVIEQKYWLRRWAFAFIVIRLSWKNNIYTLFPFRAQNIKMLCFDWMIIAYYLLAVFANRRELCP